MLVPFPDILAADRSARPVGAFTCYDLMTAAGVLRASEQRAAPVMLLISAQAFAADFGVPLVRTLRALGERASVPVTVQLDHVSDFPLIRRALEEGVQAVMADGSTLRYEDNLALVQRASELAARHGAHVEAELGHIAGDEEHALETAASGFTDPEEAERFAAESGACCLAISIGNVHGRYAGTPRLDAARLREIERRVEVPLSLHGASGLPDAELGSALGGKVRKINVNTELRQRVADVLARQLPALHASLNLITLGEELTAAIAEVVGEKLDAFEALSQRGVSS